MSHGSAMRWTLDSTGCLAISRISGGDAIGWPLSSVRRATGDGGSPATVLLTRRALPSKSSSVRGSNQIAHTLPPFVVQADEKKIHKKTNNQPMTQSVEQRLRCKPRLCMRGAPSCPVQPSPA
eukprot:364557-Chlamydomonas_euryale.AAC.37